MIPQLVLPLDQTQTRKSQPNDSVGAAPILYFPAQTSIALKLLSIFN